MDTKVRAKRKPRKCPNCTSARIAEILYGMPMYNEKFEEELRSGKIVIGGCVIDEDGPRWQCTECQLQFYGIKRVRDYE